MTDTGRLRTGLGRRTGGLVFGEPDHAAVTAALRLSTRVDLAHVIMLRRAGLVPEAAAASLLRRITELRSTDFAAVRGLPAPRGLYLMYEDHLVRELGPTTGGMVHTGRSRNDLKATCLALELRAWLLDFFGEALRLHAVLLNRARAWRHVVMPVHTHYQAAMPITYGYYLVGVAQALGRDLTALRHAADGLRACPMGAGAVAGTDLPIDPAVVARLLGFAAPAPHAVDAVASRDVLLRVLAAAATLGLTLSRLAADLQLWSTAEFGFVTFPERLVGGSSAMPQKRNAFLLEHLKAKASHAIGAWTAAAGAIRSTPFTNSIEVGTEAVAAAWPGLHAVAEAVLLAQVVVSGAAPEPARMARRTDEGFVTATALANALVRRGVPFRTAHHAVGAAVRAAVERDETALRPEHFPPEHRPPADVFAADAAAIVAATDRGGGPGAFTAVFAAGRADLAAHWEWHRATLAALHTAETELTDLVAAAVDRPVGDRPIGATRDDEMWSRLA